MEHAWLGKFLLCVLAYFLGSIPFGYLLTKIVGLGDIRQIGSGNIGATNVLRTGNKKLAALTLFLDGAKGAVAVLIMRGFYPELPALQMFAGLLSLLGHLYPLWLRFKGGKGVATAVGILTALWWPIGLMTMALWILIAFVTRYSSLAALFALGLAPIVVLFFKHDDLLLFTVPMVILVFWKHRANVGRLLKGTESKIGLKKG